MRLCILGNSHAASLKQGWDLLRSRYPTLAVVFFAARGDGLSGLTLANDCLVPNTELLAQAIRHTSGGLGEVPLGEYDAFVCYGLGYHVQPLPSPVSYSRALLEALSRDVFMDSLSGKLSSLIRALSAAPIFIGHNPLHAVLVEPTVAAARGEYSAAVAMTNRALAPDGISVIAQPTETFAQPWVTDPGFARGSTRLDVGDFFSGKPHLDSDMQHMNSDFGARWLTALFEAMQIASVTSGR